MTTEAIFAKAIELEPNQRAKFLLQACAGNDSRRRKVEQLLEAHFEEDSLLGGNALQTTSAEVSESIGESVGPYKLLQKLGEGGMGVVYLAERLKPVKQRVALKIIKSGMDSKKFIARFEAERQALAMMDHPNIAKVFDAGTTDAGRPYFVMELVKGVPITSFCEDNKVPARQRIELLLDVCHAVQHAHQKGIIHRDLKPSNVLVAMYDDKPVPKVIDFGLAKAANQTLTEKTLFTEVGSILGTWEYMSPEQAVLNQLDVDTRTDVYSLGVMLYELMTGVTPLDRRRLRQVQLRETLRIIQEEEPPRPSTRLTDTVSNTKSLATYRAASPQELTRFIRGDLDWITMKALEKDRKRRYESASRLAEDLGNFLSGDAVEARPPTWGYRASKLWRRHRWPILTAGVILVGLLTSTGVISTLLIKSRKLATDREITNDELRRNKDELVQKQAQLFKEKQRVEKSRYASHMQNAMAAWYRNDLKLMSLLLDRYRGQANDRWEWRYLNGLLESTFNEVVSETTNPNCLEISPGDGSIAMSHPYYRHFSLQRPDGTTTEFHDGAATGKWTHNFVAFSKNGAQCFILMRGCGKLSFESLKP
ncbi:MAG: serine/threonine protein kinase [Aureliella sp.]